MSARASSRVAVNKRTARRGPPAASANDGARASTPTTRRGIGGWRDLELEIVQRYASAWSHVMSRQPGLAHYYVGGFSGAGVHLGELNGALAPGSPLNVLRVEPPFRHHFLLDLDGGRAATLRRRVSGRPDVTLLEGDASDLLLRDVLPQVRAEDYRRALCVLNPPASGLDWSVFETAGRLRTIDLFVRLPVADAGGAAAFARRLREVARFGNVLEPLPVRDGAGDSHSYLFFASRTNTANHVIEEIFARHRG